MMTNDIAISVRGLGKRYIKNSGPKHNSLRDMLQDKLTTLATLGMRKKKKDYFWALSDASFDIKKGENVGIIGLNGAGKSTLLKVLSRIVTPTTGEARINGRLGALLEVGTGFHQELTGRENTYLYGSILGMTRAEVEAKFDAIIAFAEISEFIDMPVKRYSSGMYVRLAFSVAAHLDPDILLLDEVLAVGDAAFQRKCMNFARSLEKKGSTILFVSHNMYSIKTMCQRVIYLKKGKIVFDGPTSEGLKLYEDDSRMKDTHWFWSDDGERPIAFTSGSIESIEGVDSGLVQHGEKLTIRLRYSTTRRIELPDIRVSIDRQDDLHCMTFSTTADGVEIPYLEGEGELVIKTPPVRLTSDFYLANVAVRERGVGKLLAAQIIAHFHVSDPDLGSLSYGVFNEAGSWTHTPAATTGANDDSNTQARPLAAGAR
jgi:lipopolysaccharide transport system ATP-binding protein